MMTMLLLLLLLPFVSIIGLVIGQSIYAVQIIRLGKIEFTKPLAFSFFTIGVAAALLHAVLNRKGWPGGYLYPIAFLELIVFLLYLALEIFLWRRVSRLRLLIFLALLLFETLNVVGFSWQLFRRFDEQDVKRLVYESTISKNLKVSSQPTSFENFMAKHAECCEVSWIPEQNEIWYVGKSPDNKLSRADIIVNRLILGEVWARVRIHISIEKDDPIFSDTAIVELRDGFSFSQSSLK